MIVADTNLISYLAIQGTHTSLARQVYERDPVWVAPGLWRSEFLNVLATSVRGGVISERQAMKAWDMAIALVADSGGEPEPAEVLRLAVSAGISAYDAQFVVLASKLGTVLVTADRKLARSCPSQAVLTDRFVVT